MATTRPFNPADFVTFGGNKYMLLERYFGDGPDPMWLVVEPFNAYAEPRVICERDLRLVNETPVSNGSSPGTTAAR